MNGHILYKDICENIIEDIVSGIYKKGTFLPPQDVLCKKYGTSLITIKKAIELAEQKGYIVRQQGRKAMISENTCIDSLMTNKVVILSVLGSNKSNAYEKLPMSPIIKSDVENNWYLQIRQGMLSKLDPSINLISASYYLDEIVNNFENTILANIKRIVIVGGATDRLIRELKERGKELLVFGNFTSQGICCVYNDDRAISKKAIEYLIAFGHKRIAFIGTNTKNGDFAERYLGYQDALKTKNIPENGYLVRWCNYSSATEGYKAMYDLIKHSTVHFKPSAVYCADDNIAYGALKAMNELLYKCPEDFSIIGVNNYKEICEQTSPYLSSIDKNFEEIGRKIAELLNRKKWQNESHLIKCDFVIRDSIQSII